MRKTFINKPSVLLIVWSLLAGCSDKTYTEPETSGNITFSYNVEEFGAASRSILTSDDIEDKMTSLSLFVYYKDRLIEASHYKNPGNGVSISLENGREYDIYALVNMGDMTDAMPADKSYVQVEEVTWKVPSYSFIDANGLPMAGKAEGFKAGSDIPEIDLRRLFAKVCLDIGFSYEGAVISGIKVLNLNGTLKPFGSSAASTSSAIMTEVEYDSGTGEHYFYVPENMQGQIGSASASHEKNPDLDSGIKARKDVLTYMEVDVSLEENEDYIGNVIYRSYLGNDSTRNFDIRGNCCYRWDVTYHQDNLQYNDWKIDTDAVEPAAKDILEFTGRIEAGPGQTVNVSFSYDLSATGKDPSEISFTADDGLEFGTPEFTSVSANAGTGTIPLTCSTSTEIGDILHVRMEAGEVHAEAEVEVVNYVTGIKMTLPFTAMYSEYMQVTATATYYDGSTVTDPSEFTWTINGLLGSPDDIVTVKNGMLRRRLDISGMCKITVAHGGKSDVRTINCPVTIVGVEYIPDPVEIQIGEKFQGTLYQVTYNINDPENLTRMELKSNAQGSATFNISDNSIASFRYSGAFGAEITGKAKGSTILSIDVTLKNYMYSGHLDIPVIVGLYSYGLELSETDVTLIEGESRQLEAYFVTYYQGEERSRKNVTSEVVWTSDNTTLAAVSEGNITTTEGTAGSCNITARYKGYSATAGVTVKMNYIYSLILYGADELYPEGMEYISVSVGTTFNLYCALNTWRNNRFVSSEDIDVNKVIWKTSNGLDMVARGKFYTPYEGLYLIEADYTDANGIHYGWITVEVY